MADERQIYAFGPFRVDAREQVLFRDGVPVPLTPKAIAILLVLLEQRGHLVEKSQLMDAVWPDTAVEEGNLTQNIYSLRKRLGSRDEAAIAIETVPRRGYRLVGDVVVTVDPGGGVTQESDGLVDVGHSVPPDSIAALPSATDRLGASLDDKQQSWGRAALVAVALSAVVVSTASLLSPEAVGTLDRTADLVTRPVHTLPGDKLHPSLSPDGDRAAFVWNRGDGHNVFVTQLATGATAQLTFGPGGTLHPAWAPDASAIAFVRRFVDHDGSRRNAVFVIPSNGGAPRAVWSGPLASIGSGLDWSPDGTMLALAVRPSDTSPHAIALLDVATGAIQWPVPLGKGSFGDGDPVFSPTGDTLAFVRREFDGSRITLVRVGGGLLRVLPVTGHDIRRVAWTADGKSLVFSSRVRPQLWRVRIADGQAEQLPGIGEGASDPSVARRAGRLIFRQVRLGIKLYRVGLDGVSTPKLLAGSNRPERQPNISPDGTRIAFVSSRTGTDQIWIMQADGSAQVQLTYLENGVRSPRWSPDGSSIAFTGFSDGGRDRHLYITQVADGLTRRVTTKPSTNMFPAWSHDGRWLYYMSNLGGDWEIWRVPSAGGAPEQVTTDQGRKAWPSPDGKYLYYATDAQAIWRRPLAGGEPTLILRLPEQTSWGGDWVLTESGIYWVNEGGEQTIRFHDFATGRSTVAVKLPAPYDSGMEFSIAPDGSWLAYGQRDYEANDILMVDNPG